MMVSSRQFFLAWHSSSSSPALENHQPWRRRPYGGLRASLRRQLVVPGLPANDAEKLSEAISEAVVAEVVAFWPPAFWPKMVSWLVEEA